MTLREKNPAPLHIKLNRHDLIPSGGENILTPIKTPRVKMVREVVAFPLPEQLVKTTEGRCAVK